MIHGSLPKAISIIFFSLLLTACGGGGGGGSVVSPVGGGTGTTGGGTTTSPTLTLSIADSTGAATNTVNGTDTITASALFVDGNGDPVSGAVITFTAEVGELIPGQGTALTNSAGIATIDIGAGTVAGAGNISATGVLDGNQIISNNVGIQTDGLGSGVGSTTYTLSLAITSG
ncbi:MAG: Ig-like domain-containing protein, partial [Pseudomonadales bacterium]|nr:Ig-like domain-containing protein [Pseudomonadales bacterium]